VSNYSLYESGGVEPPRFAPKEAQQKCGVCGNVWFGVARIMCPKCIALDKQDRSGEEVSHEGDETHDE